MIPMLKLLGARGASGILQVPELMQRCATQQRIRRSANSLDQADAQAKGAEVQPGRSEGYKQLGRNGK